MLSLFLDQHTVLVSAESVHSIVSHAVEGLSDHLDHLRYEAENVVLISADLVHCIGGDATERVGSDWYRFSPCQWDRAIASAESDTSTSPMIDEEYVLVSTDSGELDSKMTVESVGIE